MVSVSIQVLKAQFAHWAAKAVKGEAVQITRHNRPYVMLTGCSSSHVYVGPEVGKRGLRPAIKGGTNGQWRRVLDEDREERR
jgi:antitoxin (DNA-binding transcriptional repressor) of toxin-antitoxin stability system